MIWFLVAVIAVLCAWILGLTFKVNRMEEQLEDLLHVYAQDHQGSITDPCPWKPPYSVAKGKL